MSARRSRSAASCGRRRGRARRRRGRACRRRARTCRRRSRAAGRHGHRLDHAARPSRGPAACRPARSTSTSSPSTMILSVRCVLFGPVSATFSAYQGAAMQAATIRTKTTERAERDPVAAQPAPGEVPRTLALDRPRLAPCQLRGGVEREVGGLLCHLGESRAPVRRPRPYSLLHVSVTTSCSPLRRCTGRARGSRSSSRGPSAA